VQVFPVPARGQAVSVSLGRRARYSIWLGGSIRDRVAVIVDGRRVGEGGPQLNNLGQFVELATTVLDRGTHRLELRTSHSRLRPGSGGPDYGSGPLVVSLTNPPSTVTTLSSERAPSLCGRTLDWVEALDP
jgi:hypothetical protein